MTNSYHILSRWRVKAGVEEVYDIVSQPLEYPRWWPSVYLSSKEIAPGSPDAAGRRVMFRTKGLLPWTLSWESSFTEAVPPHRIVMETAGDFTGRGVWTFVQDGDFADITFDWTLAVTSPLRYLSKALRPVVVANHEWAMEQGEICLREELIRYRAHTPKDLMDAAEPRGPVEVPVGWIAAGALAAVSAIACIVLVRRKSGKAQTAAA